MEALEQCYGWRSDEVCAPLGSVEEYRLASAVGDAEGNFRFGRIEIIRRRN